jgi:uncharacterized protein (TIGR02421 family)
MSKRSERRLPDLTERPDEFIASILDRLQRDRGVRRSLPGGWLHVDRPLPFLCVYRRPAEHAVPGLDRLVKSQASHLVYDDGAVGPEIIHDVVAAIAAVLTERFGASLVLELWAGTGDRAIRTVAPPNEWATTVTALNGAFCDMDIPSWSPAVEVVADAAPAPPHRSPLLDADEQRRLGTLLLGVEVPRVFIDDRGHPLPLVLRRLQREMASAIRRGVFEFALVQTTFRPEDFRALGPRRLLAATRRVDAALAETAAGIDYLLAVTPVDTDEAWRQFQDDGHTKSPTFHYRPLASDPDALKRQLYAVPVDDVDDPTLAGLFRAKRKELDRQVDLLEERDSDAFVHTSLQLFGGVEPGLRELAERLLELVEATDPSDGDGDGDGRSPASAAKVAARARAEVARYRAVDGEFAPAVTVRDDIPGVVVSAGDLLIGRSVKVDARRVDALLHHEVGTHLVTGANGLRQPLRLLAVGLPGYEETQEGLAVLAEYVAGGLTARRLATLAARVLAVDGVVAGATFVETFDALHHRWGLPPRRAFLLAMRVHRSGGLTKDAIYLRGLDRVLQYLAGGGSIDPLFTGKLSVDDVPVVEELRWRGVLHAGRVRPRWLDLPGAAERLGVVAKGISVLDLVKETP